MLDIAPLFFARLGHILHAEHLRLRQDWPELFAQQRERVLRFISAIAIERLDFVDLTFAIQHGLRVGKVLLATNQGPVVRDDKSRYPHNIFIARRTTLNEPFTKTELIDLPGISSFWFQSPRYLAETGELFVLVQPRSEVGTPTWKPAVIRGVRLSER